MTWQEVFDLLDEEIENSIKKMISGKKEDFEKYQAEISAYKHLKNRIHNQIKKEAEKHGKKR